MLLCVVVYTFGVIARDQALSHHGLNVSGSQQMELEKCRPAAGESKMLGKRLREEKTEDRAQTQAKEASGGGGEAAEDAGAEEVIPGEEAPQPFSRKKKKKGPKGVNPLAMKKPSKSKGAGGGQKKKKRQHRRRKSGTAVGADGEGD